MAAAVVLVGEDQGEGATAYVDRVATRRGPGPRGQRHHGIAQALLADACADGRIHGAEVFELDTAARTEALGLDEKVGMVATAVRVNRAVDLGPRAQKSGLRPSHTADSTLQPGLDRMDPDARCVW